jgi:uncharacterized pyridoxal phosphate-containing UPF0001 family protein
MKSVVSSLSTVWTLQKSCMEMKELYIGMSGDLETAIEEGSTMVRVGIAVFGARVYPDSYYWDENKTVD